MKAVDNPRDEIRPADQEWESTVRVLKLLARNLKIKNIAAQAGYSEKWVRDLRKKALGYPPSLVSTLPLEVQAYLMERKPQLKTELDKLKQQTAEKVSASRVPGVETTKAKHWEDLSSALMKLVSNLKVCARYSLIPELASLTLLDINLSEKEQEQLLDIDSFLVRCLLSHVQAELPELKNVERWEHLRLEDLTDELLHKLSLIAYQKDFKGTCDICHILT